MTRPTRRRGRVDVEPAELGRHLEQLEALGGRLTSSPVIRPRVIRSEAC